MTADTAPVTPPAASGAANGDATATTAATSHAAAGASGNILSARAVTKRFGGLVAVRSVNFEIPRGSIVSLIGPNGAGKTTFFNIIAGLTEPTEGVIDFQDSPIVARPVRAWAEPILWFALPAVAAVVSAILVLAGVSVLADVFAALTAAVLVASLLIAVIRPRWYLNLLPRFGIFRSARPNDIVAFGIGRTFQNIRLFANMTSLENVLVGMHSRMHATLPDAALRLRRHRDEERSSRVKARAWLAYVGLKGRDEIAARNLPYGDQRRLEIARALASDPKLLLLDEPTAGMNPVETAEMTALIGKIRSDLGITILLIEHDMRVVMGVSDRVTVLDHGEKIAEGTPDVVRADPKVIEAYLGAPAK